MSISMQSATLIADVKPIQEDLGLTQLSQARHEIKKTVNDIYGVKKINISSDPEILSFMYGFQTKQGELDFSNQKKIWTQFENYRKSFHQYQGMIKNQSLESTIDELRNIDPYLINEERFNVNDWLITKCLKQIFFEIRQKTSSSTKIDRYVGRVTALRAMQKRDQETQKVLDLFPKFFATSELPRNLWEVNRLLEKCSGNSKLEKRRDWYENYLMFYMNIKLGTLLGIELTPSVRAFELADADILDVVTQLVDEGAEFYNELLITLDRFKDQLGGAPNYGGLRPPAINALHQGKTLFGQPLSAVEDWFRAQILKGGIGAPFWKFVAYLVLGIERSNVETQYEYVAKSIQRYGLIMHNKEQFIDILNLGGDYTKFNRITGLAWHPDLNGIAVELLYFDALHCFLTNNFQKAKENGDAALLEYFNTLSGVCFEDRMRTIEDYMVRQVNPEVLLVKDYTSTDAAEIAFEKENMSLFEILGSKTPAPNQLLTHLRTKGVFDMEFSIEGGAREKPTLEQFHNWVISQQQNYILDPFQSLEEFLAMERNINPSENENSFVQKVNARFNQIEELDLLVNDLEEIPREESIRAWLLSQKTLV